MLRQSPIYAVARDTARFAFVQGGLALVVAITAFFLRDPYASLVFGATAGVCFAVGGLSYLLPIPDEGVQRPPATVAAAWLAMAASGAVPMVLLGDPHAGSCSLTDPSNALFESFSAFTSTGLSVACDPSALREALQLWRSLAQWAGGAGMALFAIMTLDLLGKDRRHVEAELSPHALGEDVQRSIGSIASAYCALTLLTIAGFLVVGMPGWTSINHGLTAVATGGMTVTSDSFSAAPLGAKVVAIMAMLSGGTGFGIYLALRNERCLRPIRESTQLRAYALVLVFGGLLFALAVYRFTSGAAAVDIAFEWTSAVTTCGFTVIDLSQWPRLSWIPIVAAMLIGACAGSTAGGIKLSRVTWLAKEAARRVALLMGTPGADDNEEGFEFDGEEVDAKDARARTSEAGVLVCLWLFTVLTGVFVLALLEPHEASGPLVFDTVSALGGAGLTAGFLDAQLGPGAKGVMCVLMWLGRLEIVTALALLWSGSARFSWSRTSR